MTSETLAWLAWISLFLAIFSILVTFYFHYKDCPKLIIKSIRPGINGSRTQETEQWQHQVASIEVIVENSGAHPAVGCQGVVTFPYLEALPLYPQTRDHHVDIASSIFTVEANAKIRIIGAWNYCENGSIDGTKESVSLADFNAKGLPATIIVRYGNRKIEKTLTTKEAESIIKNHQANAYLGHPIS